jgi:hypothetical protein
MNQLENKSEMNATNYHNEEVTFTLGQTVTHVTDEGEMISATITGFSDGRLLDLDFEDGDQGTELPDTCF